MKRNDRTTHFRALRGAEASLAGVAIGLDDPRPLSKVDAQEMIRALGTAVVAIADATVALGGVA